jgi:hypothetical protein
MAIALYQFIIASQSEKQNKPLFNHEKIHLKQQTELLVVFFYMLYIVNTVYNMVRYLNMKKAYLLNIFESEAYSHEYDRDFLSSRSIFAIFRKDRLNIKKNYKTTLIDAISTIVILLTGTIAFITFILTIYSIILGV